MLQILWFASLLATIEQMKYNSTSGLVTKYIRFFCSVVLDRKSDSLQVDTGQVARTRENLQPTAMYQFVGDSHVVGNS